MDFNVHMFNPQGVKLKTRFAPANFIFVVGGKAKIQPRIMSLSFSSKGN